MTTLPIFAFVILLSNSSLAVPSKPSVESAALHCLNRFSQRMNETTSYETTIEKREKGTDGTWRTDRIHLTEAKRGEHVEIVYLNEGSTGIKSNGMKVTYKAGEDLAIVYGTSKGFGGIFGSIAKSAAPKSIKLTDGLAVNEEIFTINRAGFRFMSQMILKGVQSSAGTLEGQESNNECLLKWTPTQADYQEIQISDGESIWKLEETYSTLASLIQRKNKDLFPKLSDLFRVRGTKKILVPKSLTAFTTKLDLATDLPKSFQLYWEGDLVGEYVFKDTKILSRD
jgi:hypothetical protein